MHALGFRVMRLCKPSLQGDSPLLLDLAADLTAGWQPSTPDHAALDYAAPFAGRVQLRHPSSAWGLEGMLELPQSFGVIYLGEVCLCAAPSLTLKQRLHRDSANRKILSRLRVIKKEHRPFAAACRSATSTVIGAGILHLHKHQ